MNVSDLLKKTKLILFIALDLFYDENLKMILTIHFSKPIEY